MSRQHSKRGSPQEGDLYKTVTVFGETFELRYGYYDDMDRSGKPDVIYPDFRAEPRTAADGSPFVTMMQDACPCFRGKRRRSADSTCAECQHFLPGEEWFGLCVKPTDKSPAENRSRGKPQPEISAEG